MSQVVTMTRNELITMKVNFEQALDIIGKKLQEEEKRAGGKTSAPRKGSNPIPVDQVQKSLNKRLRRIHK